MESRASAVLGSRNDGSSEQVMSSTNQISDVENQHITRIKIRKLFGHLDYDIPEKGSASTHNDSSTYDDLLIVYGDNGSGKTTILRMLFNLLSAQEGRGRKTYLAKTPFQRLEIHLNRSSSVILEKPSGQLIGGYTIRIVGPDGKPEKFPITASADGSIKADGNPFAELRQSMARLGVSLYFLPDDRRVQADLPDDMIEERLRWHNEYTRRAIIHGTHVTSEDLQWALRADDDSERESHHLRIAPVLQALVSTLRRQTIQGSNIGEENASSIYLRVVDRLINVSWPDAQATPDSNLIDRLTRLNQNIQQFARFGLLANFPADRFISTFRKASAHDQTTISGVLQPYLEGLEARLNALQELYNIVSTYIDTLNSFFSGKRIDLNIQREGISVTTQWGEAIDPNVLSSGERQLLLLLSNTVLARKRSSIFIIDEPELSLNVKWQRQLVDALLKCSHGGGIQYILASHSLELITRYQSRTVRLVPTHAG
jgi:energy-coupling factor transporter ATP-binding protein EcfA2